MITLYNVISKDGFIARLDGSEDFIPDEVWGDFIELCKQNDVVVMGRKTYEAVQYYPEKLKKEFEGLDIKKVIVTNDIKLIAKPGYVIAHSPKEAFSLGKNVLLSSGYILNTLALKENLIDRVILNILPEKIGSGIKIYEIEPKLRILSEEDREAGRKYCVYIVEK